MELDLPDGDENANGIWRELQAAYPYDHGADDGIEWRDVDTAYFEKAQSFKDNGCGCSRLHQRPCCEAVGWEALEANRLVFIELTREEVNRTILCHLQQNMAPEAAATASNRHRPTFWLHGRRICRETYLYAYNISHGRYQRLVSQYLEFGIMGRPHGNTGRAPKHALNEYSLKAILNFLSNYSDVNAMPLPGRLPRHHDFRVMLLPSSDNKAVIWRKYVDAGQDRAVSYPEFCKVWREHMPYLRVMAPSSDLCHRCQKNVENIQTAANRPEEEKQALVQEHLDHIAAAKTCRDLYRHQCTEAKEAWQQLDNEEQSMTLATSRYNVIDTTIHVSFDYAQQVFLPHNPQAPGPIYFAVPYKVALFGVCEEGRPRQVTYLIPEHVTTGKGANETLTYLDHYLDTHTVPASNIQLHCDNCVGENKNSFKIQYMLWRVATGRCQAMELSLMLAGHTKFSCDGYHGLGKHSYRRNRVNTVTELAAVFQKASSKGLLQTQLVGDDQGNVIVPTKNWKQFLSATYKHFKGITKFQCFNVSSERPGIVVVRAMPDAPAVEVNLLKRNGEELGVAPELVHPTGLCAEREWYLHDTVREFCTPATRDVLCPKPQVPRSHVKSKRDNFESHGAAVPQQEAAVPQQEAAVPQQETAVPQQETALPQQEAALPQQEAAVPQQETAVPQQEAALPQQEAALPQHETAVPQQEAAVPQQEAALPEPAKATVDPDTPRKRKRITNRLLADYICY